MAPRQTLETRLETLSKAESNGEVHPDDADAIRAFVEAYDSGDLRESPPAEHGTLAPGTLGTYSESLALASQSFRLLHVDARDVNEWLQSLKDNGSAVSTINGHGTAFRTFFRWRRAVHGDDAAPDPSDVSRLDSKKATFDPEDVPTRDDVTAMLDAASSPRDRAVIALLAYTGMRNGCLRSLRVGDVDVDAGTWTPNDEVESGLKGMEDRAKEKRPLLTARKPVREWLNYHPASDDPDAYLITGKPTYGRANPSKRVKGSTIRRITKKVAKEAGIATEDDDEPDDRRTNPHMFRHSFVTMCKRIWDMPNDRIKFLIGHSDGSQVMETTYAHLSDDDHIEKAEIAAGIRDPDDGDDEPMTPSSCPICNEPLASDAKACPDCGEVFSPTAAAIRDQLRADAAGSDAVPADARGDLAPDDETLGKIADLVVERIDG